MAQPGILTEVGAAGRFLVLRLDAGDTPLARLRQALGTLPAIEAELAPLAQGAGLRCTVAFGAALWTRLSPGARPAQLVGFGPLAGGSHRMPASGGDLLLHVSGPRPDLCFELADRLLSPLAAAVEVLEDVAGFRYLDERDLTGFIDGTENPEGAARAEAACIGAEDADFAGGSYVLAQRWVHDLERFRALPVPEQERIVGRTKPDSVELDDKPASAHISRVVIEEDGEELQIVRHSMPYGGMRERGLFFLAYARRRDIFDQMLARMLGNGDDGVSDRLLEFATPMTGAYFFAPGAAQLAKLTGG